MSDDGIGVGGHIRHYQGVLTGVPAIGDALSDAPPLSREEAGQAA